MLAVQAITIPLALLIFCACSDSQSTSSTGADEAGHVEPRPGIWGDHLVIDIHAHIGSFRGFDLSMPTLLDNLDRYGIQLALVSNIDGANLAGTRSTSTRSPATRPQLTLS